MKKKEIQEYIKKAREFTDDFVRGFPGHIPEDKYSAAAGLAYDVNISFGDADIAKIRNALEKLRPFAAEIDQNTDYYEKYQEYNIGSGNLISFSEFADAEYGKPLSLRLGNLMKQAAKERQKNPKMPVKIEIEEVKENLLLTLERIKNHLFWHTSVYVTILAVGVATFICSEVISANREWSYVAKVDGTRIELQNKKILDRVEPLSVRPGDYVIYKDSLMTKPRVRGAELFNRTADGGSITIGVRRQELIGEESVERGIIDNLKLEDQITLFSDDPNALETVISDLESKGFSGAKLKDEALIALRHRAIELGRQR